VWGGVVGGVCSRVRRHADVHDAGAAFVFDSGFAIRCVFYHGHAPARIIRRATSSIPAHRYPSVAAFARAIRWRHFWRNAAWLTVALLVLAAMAKLNSGKSHFEDASGARGSMMGNITPEVLEGVMRTGRIPSQKATAEPSIMPNVVRLNGEKVALTEPLVLEGGKEYRVSGPGTLDADLFCPTTATVRLKDCVLINRTKLGKAMRATFQDRDTAALMGVNIKGIYTATFAIGSGLAAAAGALLGPVFLVTPSMGDLASLKAFAIVILGGLGNITGATLGGFILAFVEEIGAGYISSGYRDAMGFLIIIIVLLFKPTGLFARAERIG
jgi:hypothetical protein